MNVVEKHKSRNNQQQQPSLLVSQVLKNRDKHKDEKEGKQGGAIKNQTEERGKGNKKLKHKKAKKDETSK
jgi:hypothetical protein